MRYGHFTFYSNGDMILDSSSYPYSKDRRFFGLKNNGEYFFNSSECEGSICSITVDHSNGRIEGESYCIKLTTTNSYYNGKELILGISKSPDGNQYLEIYDLNNKNFTKILTSEVFGNIYCDCFSIIKSPDESGNIYTIAYVIKKPDDFYIEIRKTKFTYENNIIGYNHVIEYEIQTGDQKILSCFYTKNLYYLCFYLSRDALYLRIRAYNSNFSSEVKTIIYQSPSTYESSTFFKGILLKGEIGVFSYFKKGENYPTVAILKCDNEGKMNPYMSFGEINLDKEKNFTKDINLNDMIKISDFQICFISTIIGKTKFKIILLKLYKDDQLMNIRYYNLEMWNDYHNIMIYLNIKADIYKNFIALAYSNCLQSSCQSVYSDPHSVSLIILSYPNSQDNSLDIISQLYITDIKLDNGLSINFEENLTIDNNLFNYTLKGTKIINIPKGIYIIDKINLNIIKNESIILKDTHPYLYFEKQNEYPANIYSIEYTYILEEDNYENLCNNKYMTSFDYSFGSDLDTEDKYYEKNEYIGKSSFFRIIINDDLITDCNNDICDLCLRNFTCITCRYNSTFYGKIKICKPPDIPTTIPTIIPTIISTIIPTTIPEIIIPQISLTIPSTISNISNTAENQECTEDEIMEKICGGRMTNKQIGEIINKLKQKISSNVSEIIETENVKFQLSTLEEQKNNINPNISSIDLKECEELLKEQEGLEEDEDLIVLKTDIKSEDLSKTFVQYEIYNPRTYNIVSLEVCGDISISISVPVTLDERAKAMYDILSQSGYNLFNLNDSFYNDICSTFTTENGTDLTLADRKNLIFNNNGNISMCQDGCTYESFNLTSQKAECDCSVQIEETITDTSKLNFDKNEFADSFFNTLKNSNFLVLKCYKLVFSIKGQTNNIGSYLMSGITFIFIILMVIYIVNGNKKIDIFIQNILKLKLNKIAHNKNNDSKQLKIKDVKNMKKIKEKKEKLKKKESEKESNINKNMKKNKSLKLKEKKGNRLKNFPPKRKSDFSMKNKLTNNRQSSIDRLRSFSNRTQEKNQSKKKNSEILRKKNNSKLLKKCDTKIIKNNNKKIDKTYSIKSTKKEVEKYKIKELNDEELNNLEYEIAILIDKRNDFQYYYSLLKKKQLILFAFLPANDYNLIAIKISLLLLAFSLYFAINGFFFSDATMNKINEDKGAFNILYQLPQIFYSTVISAIINITLKKLSLSESQILKIKFEKDFAIAQKKSKSIKRCLRIKIALFFVISFILMIFFWYFISCFCAVYKNTQKILIDDTLISFGISMLYPFGLNLLPGLLRIPAIKDPKRDKKMLYKISVLIAFFL